MCSCYLTLRRIDVKYIYSCIFYDFLLVCFDILIVANGLDTNSIYF